jgi:transcriptional regulator with XRE-family HTH domain
MYKCKDNKFLLSVNSDVIFVNLFIFVNKKMIDRIRKILDENGLSPSQFADEIQIQRSSLSHVLSGRNKPSLDFVMKIKQRFEEIDLDWLMFGKGVMIPKKSEIEISSGNIINTPKSDNLTQQTLEFDSINKVNTDYEKPSHEETDKILKDSESKVMYGKANKVIVLYANGTYEEYIKS